MPIAIDGNRSQEGNEFAFAPLNRKRGSEARKTEKEGHKQHIERQRTVGAQRQRIKGRFTHANHSEEEKEPQFNK